MKGISLEEMTDISNELKTSINIVFCGYLRQPITAEKKGEKYLIKGTCQYKNVCERIVNHDSTIDCKHYRR